MKSTFLLLRHYLLLLNFVAIINIGHSQDAPCLSNPGTNSLVVNTKGAKIISWNETRDNSNGVGVYSLWLETGDGNYATSFTGGINNNMVNIPIGQISSPPIIMATVLYEPHAHPPTSSSTLGSGSLSFVTSTTSNKMRSFELAKEKNGKLIKLFSNLKEIVEGDRMVFGISYIPNYLHFPNSDSNYYRLIFRYNNGQSTFQEANGSSTSKMIDFNTKQAIDIKDVRFFGKEVVSLPSSNDLIGYNNVIAFDSIHQSEDTFNIFVSLLPNPNIGNTGTGNLEAVLFWKNRIDSNWLPVDISSIAGMQIEDAHDPNWISVSPQCLPLPQSANLLHYTINFQNTGLGDADSLIAVFNCPNQTNRANQINKLIASYGKVNTAIVTIDSQNFGKIIFKIGFNPNLQGCKYPNTIKSKETMGKISFDLEILPGPDPLKPEVLEAWAEIYLHSKVIKYDSLRRIMGQISSNLVSDSLIKAGLCYPGTFGYEIPVRTNNAVTVFSKCCNDTDNCSCKHPRGFWQWLQCYWWILLIILLLIVIWWLYRNRHHH